MLTGASVRPCGYGPRCAFLRYRRFSRASVEVRSISPLRSVDQEPVSPRAFYLLWEFCPLWCCSAGIAGLGAADFGPSLDDALHVFSRYARAFAFSGRRCLLGIWLPVLGSCFRVGVHRRRRCCRWGFMAPAALLVFPLRRLPRCVSLFVLVLTVVLPCSPSLRPFTVGAPEIPLLPPLYPFYPAAVLSPRTQPTCLYLCCLRRSLLVGLLQGRQVVFFLLRFLRILLAAVRWLFPVLGLWVVGGAGLLDLPFPSMAGACLAASVLHYVAGASRFRWLCPLLRLVSAGWLIFALFACLHFSRCY